MRNSQVGDLLVATTEVDGTVLNRGVCLVVYEDEQTAIGLMLNRPLQMLPISAPELQALQAEVGGDEDPDSEPAALQTPNRLDEILPSKSIDDLSTQPLVAVVGTGSDPQAGQMLLGKSLHFGGPLSGPVVAVHGAAELGESEAGEGIYVAAQRDHLEALMQAGQPHPYRLIVGHLGWSKEQLSEEIAAGVWHRLPATTDILSTADEWLWPKLIRRATASSMSRWLGHEHVADAHLLN